MVVGKVAPPSLEITVVPATPTATAVVAFEKATDSRFWAAGETSVPVWPPSVVRTSELEPPAGAAAVTIRQFIGSLQEICVRTGAAPPGSASGSFGHLP